MFNSSLFYLRQTQSNGANEQKRGRKGYHSLFSFFQIFFFLESFLSISFVSTLLSFFSSSITSNVKRHFLEFFNYMMFLFFFFCLSFRAYYLFQQQEVSELFLSMEHSLYAVAFYFKIFISLFFRLFFLKEKKIQT